MQTDSKDYHVQKLNLKLNFNLKIKFKFKFKVKSDVSAIIIQEPGCFAAKDPF